MSEFRTDYKNDKLLVSSNTRRKFRVIENSDGTVSFEDVTVYEQKGDNFSADEINAIHGGLNELDATVEVEAAKLAATSSRTAEAYSLAEEADEKADTATNIAKGRNQSIAYTTYEAMVAALNAMGSDELKVGQNIYIGILGVPDLWVYGVVGTKSEYAYKSDEAIVSTIEANTVLQIGHYYVSFLEGQKVDLEPINTMLGMGGFRALNGVSDCNNISIGYSAYVYANTANAPSKNDNWVVFCYGVDSNNKVQIACMQNNIYIRRQHGGAWNSWTSLAKKSEVEALETRIAALEAALPYAISIDDNAKTIDFTDR